MENLSTEVQNIILYQLANDTNRNHLLNDLISCRTTCSTFSSLLYNIDPQLFFGGSFLKDVILLDFPFKEVNESSILRTLKLIFIVFFYDKNDNLEDNDNTRFLAKNMLVTAESFRGKTILQVNRLPIKDKRKVNRLFQLLDDKKHSRTCTLNIFILKFLLILDATYLQSDYRKSMSNLILSILILFLRTSLDDIIKQNVSLDLIKDRIKIVMDLCISSKYFPFLFTGIKMIKYLNENLISYRSIFNVFRLHVTQLRDYSIAKENFYHFLKDFGQTNTDDFYLILEAKSKAISRNIHHYTENFLKYGFEEDEEDQEAEDQRISYLFWIRKEIELLFERYD